MPSRGIRRPGSRSIGRPIPWPGCAVPSLKGSRASPPLRMTSGPGPRQHPGLGPGDRALATTLTDAPRLCLIADPIYDVDALSTRLARQGLEAVIPAWIRHAPPLVPRRGWLQCGQRVATCYDPYAHRCLGFLYLAAAWIWLHSNINATQPCGCEFCISRRVGYLETS